MTDSTRQWLDDPALYEGVEDGEARSARRALIERLAAQGVGHKELLGAVRENRLAALPAELVLGHQTPYTLTQVARRARLDSRFLRQALLALGRPNPGRGERVFGEDDVRDALLALLEAVEKEGDEFPQLRAGAAYGNVVSRGGDWFGAPVNLASRLTEAAKPGTIHVSAEARKAAGKSYGWTRRRRKALKGLGRVAYFRLAPA